MRTVLKAVIRSASASVSAASSAMSRESQDINPSRLKKDFVSSEILNSILIHNITDGLKNNSLSPSYKLSLSEETSFDDLLDKEYEYYPDNSLRGDMKIINIKSDNGVFLEKNVNSENVMVSLKNIRFINSIIFNESPIVFLIAANYIHRLLYKKAVKKDLMPFIATAVYDFALQCQTNKALTSDQITSLLSVSNIPINHIEDFSRIKHLLLNQLNNDLQFVIITDYLQILLKFDVHQTNSLSDTHIQLIDIACVLATSCELTHFTLACQAISLVNLAGRHVSLNKSFLNEFSDIINKFPLIFLSPVRLTQFANAANVEEFAIEQCTESIIRYYAKYYSSSKHIFSYHRRNPDCKKDSFDKARLSTVVEEVPIFSHRQPNFNVNELIDKLNQVSSALINSHVVGGRQKKRHKRLKKTLSRQLKKYGKDISTIKQLPFDLVDEDDSAISSSSNMTSPSNSPLTF